MRNAIKPIIFKLLGEKAYEWFYYRAKVRDIKNNIFSEEELEYIPALLHPSDEIIDVGANYGHFSAILSRYVPKGKVFSFEPIPFTFNVNKRILTHLKINNVLLFNKGVGEKNEVLNFAIPQLDSGALNTGLAHLAKRDSEVVPLKMSYVKAEIVALDDFLLDQLTRITFIKIDIEGAELFALKGMRNIISRFKPVVMIEVSLNFLKAFNISSEELIHYVKNEMGYDFYIYNPHTKGLVAAPGMLKNSNYFLKPR